MRKRCFVIALLLVVCLVALCACNNDEGFKERPISAINLTANVQSRAVVGRVADASFKDVYNGLTAKFAANLYDGKNLCISPLSISAALGMVANGAKGNTKAEFESLFGVSIDELNEYFATVMEKSGESKELHVANSVWSRNGEIDVSEGFLDIVKNYYGAQAYSSDFDEKTVQDVNNWVYNNTRGGIDKIVEEIKPETVMMLINALDFESEWKEKFMADSIEDGVFKGTNGDSNVSMMYAKEESYIEVADAKGFVKPYANSDYKFVGVLPDDDISIADFVAELTSKKITDILTNIKNTPVNICIPKFDFEYECELKEPLKKLGFSDVFNSDTADFSGLGKANGNKNLFINSILHKTHITVNEAKTKASAVTKVDVDTATSPPNLTPAVILNRPFVFMILDADNLPIFIGVIANL